MTNEMLTLLAGEVLEEDVELTLAELCRLCQVPAERVFELVEQGVVHPQGHTTMTWRFRGISLNRAQRALRLERDLGINVAGAALALDLLEELQRTRAQLRRLGD